MRGYFFPTPPSVVDSVVASELAGRYQKVLEPAVGDGALLRVLKDNYDEILAYDIDQNNLIKAAQCVDKKKAKMICADFLEADVVGKFDLILSNPPFNNNLAHYIDYDGRRMAIELAFVKKCLGLLSESGVAIFILPSSIMIGDRSKWLRKYILGSFTVKSIFKLAKFSFKSVEGGFYVLKVINKLPLDNYCVELSTGPGQSYSLNSTMIEEQGYCLDPDNLARTANYLSIAGNIGSLPFVDVASLARGNVSATGKKPYLFHSTDFKSHVAASKKYLKGEVSSANLLHFCIVLKRVCRSASKSFSLYLGRARIPCSDCVIVITPKDTSEVYVLKLLLALRVSVVLGGGAIFEISGSGANYISVSRLKSFRVIQSKLFDDSGLLLRYERFLRSFDFDNLHLIEESLAKKILDENSALQSKKQA